MPEGWVLAQDQSAPESLLPPGFDEPEPAPTPTSRPGATPVEAPANRPVAAPSEPATAPPAGAIPSAPAPDVSAEELSRLPSLEELEELSTEELDALLGLKPKFDIPPAARRSLARVGLLAPSEGGLPARSFARQPRGLVRAILAGTDGVLVSRWGHILVRRALVSRLAAPRGMNPVSFVALRAGVLNRMGEYAAARALVQDVDTENWNDALGNEAIAAFIGAGDPVGACPYIRLRGLSREEREADPRRVMLSAICNAYAGESARAVSQLDSALNNGIAPAIDILLARRYAGAAGRGQRGVAIEWDDVDELNPWRFALANAVGEPIPERLYDDAPPYFARAGAAMAMAPLGSRGEFAARAASEGILSSRALIDLYSTIYADEALNGALDDRARQLRTAYIANDPAQRVAAITALWEAFEGNEDYAGKVLTSYAAARIPPSSEFAEQAGGLIAAMLAAGLDRDAALWAEVVEEGSAAWALLALANPRGDEASLSAIDSFVDADESAEQRRSRFLVASLAGLGRIDGDALAAFEDRLDLGLDRQSRWSRMIARAAEVGNPAMVALLAGLGMQGDDWAQMTPLHLFRITAALTQVGLEAEARMIAAEAVARA
ncbi:MAG: hypothetical protein V2I27_09570 [Erythrobacter sp.]|nr:hypothetical protein [Erythrobacter sp.]